MATGSINISSNISRNALLVNYPPKPCNNFEAKADDRSIKLSWTDPDDFTTTDGIHIQWKFTRVVRKTGSYPVDETDGTIVVESSIKNQYSDIENSPFIDKNLSNNVEYFYRAFSCSTINSFNHEPVQLSITPIPWKIMTVRINLNNSNPSTCGKYDDSAIGMISGSVDWDNFFGFRPCAFKDGKVLSYLNPKDLTKTESGESINITDESNIDLMIEFPRRGLRISKSSDKILTISMTDNPSSTEFKYYAHQRGSNNKKYFYLGRYMGYITRNSFNKNTLRSISNIDYGNLDGDSYTRCKEYAQNRGNGYGILGFYQFLYIQCMYLLKYKGDLDSQKKLGTGYGSYDTTGNVNEYVNTGVTDSLMSTVDSMTGYIKSGSYIGSMSVFGLEHFIGNTGENIDNILIDTSGHVYTTTDDTILGKDINTYNNTGSIVKTINSAYESGFITDVIGSTEAGLLPLNGSLNGSYTTYFCDFGSIDLSNGINRRFMHGNPGENSVYCDGMFHILSASTSYARLQYL